MANGLSGSRFPVANYIATHFVLLAVRYYIMYRQIRNKIHSIIHPTSALLYNSAHVYYDFKKWLDMGYDKINLGGGHKNLDGFINIDFISSTFVKRQVVANILDLSFIEEESITQIHSNHVIEHLTEHDLEKQVIEWYRILKPEGVLTIRCPNILGAADGFWFEPILENDRDEFIRLSFPPEEDFCNPEDRWLHKDLFGLMHWFYGDVGNIANQHLIQITPTKLRYLLESNGFKVVKITNPESLNIVVIARKFLNSS